MQRVASPILWRACSNGSQAVRSNAKKSCWKCRLVRGSSDTPHFVTFWRRWKEPHNVPSHPLLNVSLSRGTSSTPNSHFGVLPLRHFYFKNYDKVKNYTHGYLRNIIKHDGEESQRWLLFAAFEVGKLAVTQSFVNDHHLADDFVCIQRRNLRCSLLAITLYGTDASCGLETDGRPC